MCPKISFVSPVYRAENIIEKLVSEIIKVMEEIDESFEIILVDDRSPDNGWRKMKQLSHQYDEVKSVRLSRNFGQHPAIMAGLSQTKGEWIVVLDCDLQDQPKEVIKLYGKAMEGYDVVLAKRKRRQDSFFKKMTSKAFALVYGFFTDTEYDNEVANFGVYHKKVIYAVLNVKDHIKFFPLFVYLVGFKSVKVEVEHSERDEGKSSYTIARLLSMAFDTIISFSNKPLKLFVKFGMLVSVMSFAFGLYNISLYTLGKIKVLGYSSLIVSVWFLSGIIITIIGITGIYLGKVFNQVKGRPVFVIDEMV